MSYCFDDIDLSCEECYRVVRTNCNPFTLPVGLTPGETVYVILLDKNEVQYVSVVAVNADGSVPIIPEDYGKIISKYGGEYPVIISDSELPNPQSLSISSRTYNCLLLNFEDGDKFCGCSETPSQTFLNNPDFNEFPNLNVVAPDGTYGWLEIFDDLEAASLNVNECPGRKIIRMQNNTGFTGDWSWENTAILEGGRLYDVKIYAQSFGVTVYFDAFINGVAQGVGDSIDVNHGLGDCDGIGVEWLEYTGTIDATGISDFKFRIFGPVNVFDIIWITEINCDAV